MGLDADVIGFGPFSDSIRECLDYPEDYYESTNEGQLVVVSFFPCVTDEQSRFLAESLGCEVWDFNTHEIDAGRVDRSKLEQLFREEDVKWFFRCMRKGFKFFYRPNG
jgi:hypothetical protein